MKRTIQIAESASMHRSSVVEAVDPKLFGELRAVLQDPYEGKRDGAPLSFLDSVWRVLSRIKTTVSNEEFEGEVMPYVNGILSRVKPENLLLSASEFDILLGTTRTKWGQDRIDFYMQNHRGFINDGGGFGLDSESLNNALKIKSSIIANPDGGLIRFELYDDVLKSKRKLASFFEWVKKGAPRIRMNPTEEHTPATGVARVKSVMSALPSGLDLLMMVAFNEAPRNEAVLTDIAERLRAVTIKPQGSFSLHATFDASNLNRVDVLEDLVRDRVIKSYKKSVPEKISGYSKSDGYILQF